MTQDFAHRQVVAWGASALLEFYLRFADSPRILSCIDSDPARHGAELRGVKIVAPAALDTLDRDTTLVVNFAIASPSIQAIQAELTGRGFTMGIDCTDFAEFARAGFQPRAQALLGRRFDEGLLAYARAFNLESNVPLETTVLGNWLLLEALRATTGMPGAIAEVGAFQCGNACLLLNAMSLWGDARSYYVFDSFRGFGGLSPQDPAELAGSYDVDYGASHILNRMRLYPQARVITGFVPESFREVPEGERFSLVFFDCDLYQPALDTFHFIWERLLPGGVLAIHDYVAADGGWTGIRAAAQEFFAGRGVPVHDLWETTMGIVFKPGTAP